MILAGGKDPEAYETVGELRGILTGHKIPWLSRLP